MQDSNIELIEQYRDFLALLNVCFNPPEEMRIIGRFFNPEMVRESIIAHIKTYYNNHKVLPYFFTSHFN